MTWDANMQSVRLFGRGLADTLDHLLAFTAVSLMWWITIVLIVPGPAGTVALFAMTDPRRAGDRPDWREAVDVALASFRRGWTIALLIVPLVVVLLWNLSYYDGSQSRIALLIPLWISLLVLTLAVGMWAFAVVALMETGAAAALRTALALIAKRPIRTLAVVIVLWLLVALGSLLIVPLFMFVPAMVAAIINRFVLNDLGVAIPDALAPTDERRHEERVRQSGRVKP